MNLKQLFRDIEGELLSAEDSVDEVYKKTSRPDFD